MLMFDVAQAMTSKAQVARQEKQNVGRAQMMSVDAGKPNQGAGVYPEHNRIRVNAVRKGMTRSNLGLE